MSALATKRITIRVEPADAAAIKQRAQQQDTSITRLLIDTVLGRLPEQRATLEQRVDTLQERLERLEGATFGR